MDYFSYNTDANSLVDQPRPRFRVLIDKGFAAAGGDRRYGEKFAQLAQGDILLMYENRVGVVSIGRVRQRWDRESHESPWYYTADEMKLLTGAPYEYRIAVDWFLDLSHSPISVQELKRRLGYQLRATVRKIDKKRAEVERIIEELRAAQSLLPEEIVEPSLYVEGASRQVLVNAYERSSEARRRCVEHYGTTCCICGFDFGAVYGAEAKGYIHVHHIRPLSEIGGEYVLDPVEDLRPVCPNCHAVLHLDRHCRTIEEVRRLLERQRQA